MAELNKHVSPWGEESEAITLGGVQRRSSEDDLLKNIDLQIGDKVGRFVLLSKLGEGGMGCVYAAYDPDLDRKVALKFLRPDTGLEGTSTQQTDAARSRLIQEAQSMARLSHPNVVAIFDVGLIKKHVFLAMELIEGKTLKSWIKAGGYTYWQATKKFLAAGQGLLCAHAAGLIHRDFKPDNVFVSYDERVCVGDFGLVYRNQQGTVETKLPSKSMNTELSMATESECQTQRGAIILGTPSYMSPEQHRGELATAQSDQYSFCVCLFEALYGVLPYRGRNREEILTAIESGRLNCPSGTNHVPRRIHQIITRGLSFDPEQRYPSMHELLEDLSSQQPRRFFNSSRVSLSAAIVIAAGNLISGSVDVEAKQRCTALSHEIDVVWTENQRALAKESFRNSKFNESEKIWSNLDRSLLHRRKQWSSVASDLCEQAHVQNENIEGEFELQKNCLTSRMVELETFVGLLENAETMVIKKSESILSDLPTAEACKNLEVLQRQNPLPSDLRLRGRVQAIHNDVRRADILRKMGQRTSAVELIQEARYQALEIGYAPALAEVYLLMAWMSEDVFDFETAQEENQRALTYAEAGHDDELIVTAAAQGIFINSHVLRESEEVDDWIEHTRAHLDRAGNPPLLRAKWLTTTGVAYGVRGRLAESELMFREALEIFSRELGEGHRRAVKVRTNLAIALELRGKLGEAEFHLRKSIALLEESVGTMHPSLLFPMSSLSTLLVRLGSLQEALQWVNRGIGIAEHHNGKNSRQAIREYEQKANLFLLMGKYRDALTEVSRVLEIYQTNRFPKSIRTRVLYQLAEIRIRLGEIDRAASIIDQQLIKPRSKSRPGSSRHLKQLRRVEALLKLGRRINIESEYEKLRRLEGENDRNYVEMKAKTLYLMGELKRKQKQTKLAESLFLAAFDEAKRIFPGEDNVNRIPYQRAVAGITMELGDWSFASQQMSQVIDILQRKLPESPNLLASARLQHAKIFVETKQWGKAHALLVNAKKLDNHEDFDPREWEEIDRLLERVTSLCGDQCVP